MSQPLRSQTPVPNLGVVRDNPLGLVALVGGIALIALQIARQLWLVSRLGTRDTASEMAVSLGVFGLVIGLLALVTTVVATISVVMPQRSRIAGAIGLGIAGSTLVLNAANSLLGFATS